MDSPELLQLLERSHQLDDELSAALDTLEREIDLKQQLAWGLAMAVFEHGRGLRALLRIGNATASFALLRPQMEAFERHIWIREVADDEWIAAFVAPVEEGAVREPVQFFKRPRLRADLIAAGHEPEANAIQELHDQLGDAHHSWTHGGLRAIQIATDGAPLEQEIEMVKVSNAVTINGAYQLAKMLRGEEIAPRLWAIGEAFPECFLGRVSIIEGDTPTQG